MDDVFWDAGRRRKHPKAVLEVLAVQAIRVLRNRVHGFGGLLSLQSWKWMACHSPLKATFLYKQGVVHFHVCWREDCQMSLATGYRKDVYNVFSRPAASLP